MGKGNYLDVFYEKKKVCGINPCPAEPRYVLAAFEISVEPDQLASEINCTVCH